jgi:predicted transcriptional regulator/transcriptional regulator with XRE-family HTH domain
MSNNLGPKVRALRRKEGLTQTKLAGMLGISPSYLNLIEHNHRPLTAPLLISLARQFHIELDSFSRDNSEQIRADLMEAFSDPVFEGFDLIAPQVRKFAIDLPAISQAVASLYEAYQSSVVQNQELTTRLIHDPNSITPGVSPSEEVSAFLQRHLNHFPNLDAAAEQLWDQARLGVRGVYQGLVDYLQQNLSVTVTIAPHTHDKQPLRAYDSTRRHLVLSELLAPRSRNFQLATQVALLTQGNVFDRLTTENTFTSQTSRKLARIVLAQYFSAALIMPYGQFLAAAREFRYDIAMLGHRFRTSFEQVVHRLSTLRRPGSEGVPIFMVRTDLAGNISKRFSANGFRVSRFLGTCPKWGLFQAFITPGMIRTQISEIPSGDRFFSISRTVRHHEGGHNQESTLHAITFGCRIEDAENLVYADSIDLNAAPTPIGVSCQICPRTDCAQRAFPQHQKPIQINENIRNSSLYTT